MREIVTKKGKRILVDDEDFERLNAHPWHLSTNGYAVRRVRVPGGRRTIYMHHDVHGEPEPGQDVEHRDGNRLNNSRANLRAASRTLNNANAKLRGGTSRFKGVHFHKLVGKWWAYINRDKKRTSLGFFADEVEAAKAYNAAAVQFFGEFARLNPIPQES